MALYVIGLGLHNEQDITLKGLEAVKKCEKLYLEYYTSRLGIDPKKLEEFYGKPIIVCDREAVEQQAEQTILVEAAEKDVAFLVIGDVMSATTHADLILRAKEQKIPVHIVNNASILNVIGNIGLELYKFGKTTSIVFPQPNYFPETCYNIIKENQTINAHTLCLLDIHADKEKCMSVNEGLQVLLDIENKRKEQVISEETFVIGCARIGCPDQLIVSGKLGDIMKKDFGKPLHCIVIPGKNLHFKEEEMLGSF